VSASEPTTQSHVLEIKGLRAGVAGKEILKGIDLTVRSGEVHAIMGPNGSGKSTLSHVIMGRPGYEVLAGTVTLDGVDVLSLTPWERAQAGLYLAMQYPTEVPGVPVLDVLEAAFRASGRDASEVADLITAEAKRIGFDDKFLLRAMNVDLSGGEKKRNETLQLGVLRPAIAILDELDSGLDVDALRACSRRIEEATNETGLGVLAITHYSRLLHELRPDHVHVLARGVIQRSGGADLATELESTGYAAFGEDQADTPSSNGLAAGDPFADPLA
jgi:Fe-S cluster assembly ATP-binding protein